MPRQAADPDQGATTPTVTVRGEAVVRAEPDEALLWVTLTALEDDPGRALADVSRRSEALVTLLDELGIAKTDRSTTGVTVYEGFDHTSRGRRSLGHRAAAGIAARLTAPDLIGRLITEATTELHGRINGPRWQIAAQNPVRLQAAREASGDGRRKAQAFADGAGAKLGRLISLSESAEAGHHLRRMGGVRPMAAQAAEPMPIEPGEHEVGAAIDLTFALDLA